MLIRSPLLDLNIPADVAQDKIRVLRVGKQSFLTVTVPIPFVRKAAGDTAIDGFMTPIPEHHRVTVACSYQHDRRIVMSYDDR